MLSDNQKQFVYWIKERESIRLKKVGGLPAPWSDDVIMQSTYFCNVNREDDKVTKWIRDNWLYIGEFKHLYILSMIIARIFNWPPTLATIGQPIHINSWLKFADTALKQNKKQGKKIWNGAYIISTNGKKVDKLTHCIDMIKNIANNKHLIQNCTTLKQAHGELVKQNGLGSFLSAQVVADLKNTVEHPLHNAPDWMSFSAPGPGSLRGLTWFWEKRSTPKTYTEDIQRAWYRVEKYLPEEVVFVLCMQNFQNCFCEYDKFMRVKSATGKSKRKYDGVGGTHGHI